MIYTISSSSNKVQLDNSRKDLSFLQSLILNAEDLNKSILNPCSGEGNEDLVLKHIQKTMSQNSKFYKQFINDSKLSNEDTISLKAMFMCHKDLVSDDIFNTSRSSKTKLNKNKLTLKTDIKYSLESSGYIETMSGEIRNVSSKLLEKILNGNYGISQRFIENKLYNANTSGEDTYTKLQSKLVKIIQDVFCNAIKSGSLISELSLDNLYKDAYNSLSEDSDVYDSFASSLPVFIFLVARNGDKCLLDICGRLRSSTEYEKNFNKNKNTILEDKNKNIDNNQKIKDEKNSDNINKTNSEKSVSSKASKKDLFRRSADKFKSKFKFNNKKSMKKKNINNETDINNNVNAEDTKLIKNVLTNENLNSNDSVDLNTTLGISNLLNKLTTASLIIHAD